MEARIKIDTKRLWFNLTFQSPNLMSDLCILPNYHTVHLGLSNLPYKLKRKISREDFMRGIFNDAYKSDFFFWFSLRVKAIQKSTNNICLYKEVHKSI